MRSPFLWAIVPIIVFAGLPNGKAQTIRVRSTTQLELDAVRRERSTAVIATLRDDSSAPIAGAVLRLEVLDAVLDHSALVHEGTTDVRGQVVLEVRVASATLHVGAIYRGDELYGGAHIERTLDPGASPPRLSIVTPAARRLDLDAADQRAVVRFDGGVTEGVTIALFDERGVALGEEQLDDSGHAEFRFASRALSDVGWGKLKVRATPFDGSPTREVETDILRTRRSRISLHVSHDEIRLGEPLTLRAELRNAKEALAAMPVSLYVGGKAWSTLRTDRRGQALFTLEPQHTGVAEIDVRFDGDGLGNLASRSEKLRVEVAEAFEATWIWLAFPWAFSLLVLALARRKPRRKTGLEAIAVGAPAVELGQERGRTRRHFTISGSLIGAAWQRDRPPTTAHLLGGARTIAMTLDADGRFRSPHLEKGVWRLRAEADGFLAEEASFRIPHRGELHGLRVRLRSRREYAQTLFHRVASHIVSEQEWPLLTNQEIVAREAGLAPLGRSVDEAAYQAEDPTHEQLRAIEEEIVGATPRER